MEWQPIETAPRAGTVVLIGGGTVGDDQSAFFCKRQFVFVTIAAYEEDGRRGHHWRGDSCGGHDEYFWHDPTHWMPLPAPPNNPS